MSETPGPRRIFTYGTLMASEVMEALLGRRPPACPALLEGHTRYALRGRAYPGLVDEAGARTRGVLYGGLDAASVALIDHYESNLYERRHVRVRAAAGAELEAEAYVLRASQRHVLSGESWDLARFRAEHLAETVRHCAALRGSGLAEILEEERNGARDQRDRTHLRDHG